jgi:hypothetical protein
MADQSSLHLDESGTISKPRTQSPKVIHAWSLARDTYARTVIGGVLLALLTIAYIVALFMKAEGASNILVLLGSGLGFLLGGRDKSSHVEG